MNFRSCCISFRKFHNNIPDARFFFSFQFLIIGDTEGNGKAQIEKQISDSDSGTSN